MPTHDDGSADAQYNATGELKVRLLDKDVEPKRETTEYRVVRCEERIASLEKELSEARLFIERHSDRLERLERDLGL